MLPRVKEVTIILTAKLTRRNLLRSQMTSGERSWELSYLTTPAEKSSSPIRRTLGMLNSHLATFHSPWWVSRRRSTRRGAYARTRKRCDLSHRLPIWSANWIFTEDIKTRWASHWIRRNEIRSWTVTRTPLMLRSSSVPRCTTCARSRPLLRSKLGGASPRCTSGSESYFRCVTSPQPRYRSFGPSIIRIISWRTKSSESVNNQP